MRPYLAIIKDSFRAAMASRVLYVLFFLIAFLLLVLAPLHMRETLDWKLIANENTTPDQLARRLVDRYQDEKQKPIARIWELLSDDLKKRLLKLGENPAAKTSGAESEAESDDQMETPVAKKRTRRRGPRGGNRSVEEAFVYQELIDELNAIIQDRDFYRQEDWSGRVLSAEAEGLLESGVENLNDERMKRLNRLLIAQSVSPAVKQGQTALEFWYAIWKAEFLTTSSTHQQFAQNLTSQLPFYFDKFVLSIGLFIAILVTANMIPDTFEPGSLNLLLSKPISRWGLYLAKFVGGCVFILLCAAFLFLGVWLWLGLAMDVWDRAILFSIPLYVLVFAIYFSVSALVGLVWRSPIVSVILTLLFWTLCTSVGYTYLFFAIKMGNSELLDLREVNGRVVAVDSLLQLKKWDEGSNEWAPVLEAQMTDEAKIQFGVNSYIIPMRNIPSAPGVPGAASRFTPVYDEVSSQVIATTYTADLLAANKKLFVANSEDLKFLQVGEFPRESLRLMKAGSELLVATSDGEFFRLDRNVLATLKARAAQQDAKKNGSVEPNETNSKEDVVKKLFVSVGPNKRVGIRSKDLVAANPENGRIAVYRRGKLTVFVSGPEGEYVQHASLEIDATFDKDMSCIMEYKGNTIVLVFGNGKVISVDATALEELNEYQPESRSAVDTIEGSMTGRFFAVRYRNGNLWLLDTDHPETMKKADVTGQGEICAFGFGAGNRLWVSDNTDRATDYDLATDERGNRLAPGGTWLEKSFRYGIAPIYKAFPKPGEFYKVVTHLSSSGNTADNDDVDLRRNPFETDNPWLPLRSGLIFMGLMIFVACVIFHFKDF